MGLCHRAGSSHQPGLPVDVEGFYFFVLKFHSQAWAIGGLVAVFKARGFGPVPSARASAWCLWYGPISPWCLQGFYSVPC